MLCDNWDRILGRNPDNCLEFSSLLFKVASTALPCDLYFFKITQPLHPLPLLCTVKEKRGKPGRKPHRLCLRNPYRDIKCESSQDNAQKPQTVSSWIWLLEGGKILGLLYMYCRCMSFVYKHLGKYDLQTHLTLTLTTFKGTVAWDGFLS